MLALRIALFGTSLATIGSMTAPSLASVASRARALSDASTLGGAFESSFGDTARGWSNWLLEGRLMIGQYPHCQPAHPGPSGEEAYEHLARVIDAGIDCFCCLQAELPPQDDGGAWPTTGIPLPDASDRERWPATFVRYAAEADAIALERQHRSPRYLHYPITDLSIPKDMDSLVSLLSRIIDHYEAGGGAVYLHCWGGRGRAGLVGACLLSLLRPELDDKSVLDLVQSAYDTRRGAAAMQTELKRSPQTEPQRQFVRSFVRSVRTQCRYANDLSMKDGGMPAGFM